MLLKRIQSTSQPVLIVSVSVVIGVLFLPSVVRAEDIVLGMSAAFTGPSQALGIELYRGSMAYFEEVNQQGGINGKKIVIRAYDDGYNPIPAIQNTIQLVEKDQAFALFNYVGTPTVTRILPLLKRYQDRHIYLLFPFTGAQPQRQDPYKSFVFNLRASYQEETAGLVDNFLKIGRQRIAVFYQADAYGRSGWDGVRRELAHYGLKIVTEATYRRGTTYSQSLQTQVKILQKAKPDAIISIGSYAACAALIRDARDAGLNIPIANISFVGSESLLKLLQQTGTEKGKDYTKYLINSQVVPSYEDTSLPAVQEYRRLMQRHNPKLPPQLHSPNYQPFPYSFVSFEGFLNAKLLVEILKQTPKELSLPELESQSQQIKEFQERLAGKGFFFGSKDGVFETTTQEALMAFQKSENLEVTGEFNTLTQAALLDYPMATFQQITLRKEAFKTAESFEDIDLGIDATVSFDSEQHQGLNRIYYTTIENGQFVPLKNWQVWKK